jgi:glycogen phosphorylase
VTLANLQQQRLAVDSFRHRFLDVLAHQRGVTREFATQNDLYHALATTVRQYLMDAWLDTLGAHLESEAKFVAYLSAEYLLGRQLDNALLSSGLTAVVEGALADLDLSLDDLRDEEVEPGLGNGGLGRLAACFMDSLARLDIPAVGYGIRYEFGIFRQEFDAGRQLEQPDEWLRRGNPWEFPHHEMSVRVCFGGTVVDGPDGARVWRPAATVDAVPYNYLVPGYGTVTVNTLRLWAARATSGFDLQIFNAGDYTKAVGGKIASENITKVLYPDDTTPQGKRLRLQQQYFFTAASLHDIIRLLGPGFDLHRLPERITVQLNDTHPAIAVAELMRILVDEHGMLWDDAWEVTRSVCNYTCHTLLPEALEVWPAALLGELLPRHLEIIERINGEFCDEVRTAFPGDEDRVRRMTIVAEGGERGIRMAHLATVGGRKVNGVAELQSQLLRTTVLRDFAELYPDKFTNVTNGVTPRRFVRLANPSLSELVTEALGSEKWVGDLDLLHGLEDLADDPSFQERFRAVKRADKERAAPVLESCTGVAIMTDALMDVMVKRLHEYKRQTLKILHVIALHQRLQAGGHDVVPRVVVFGAKAAPGYWIAKEIINVINDVAAVVNADPACAGRLQVVFPPNYNVTLAERIIPAADLSEQISMAGKEASGTGNMKFALNGALTIGTLDGANVEIRELVGEENFFLFGLTEPEARALKASGYDPRRYYEGDPVLRAALDAMAGGVYASEGPDEHKTVAEMLIGSDPFLALADFGAYVDAQDRVEDAYRDTATWTRMAILNVARCGFFSSDRSMRDYLDRIWGASPVDVEAWRRARNGRH